VRNYPIEERGTKSVRPESTRNLAKGKRKKEIEREETTALEEVTAISMQTMDETLTIWTTTATNLSK